MTKRAIAPRIGASGTAASLAAAALALLLCAPSSRAAESGSDLYTAHAIVTGQGEENRRLGFRECLGEVLVKVSGDPDITADGRFPPLLAKAGELVESFRYRDLLEGVPIHDEQGTHDRPHDLTCAYAPAMLDPVLAALGRRPWIRGRPALALFLAVQQNARLYLLSRDGDENPAMEEALASAAQLLGLAVTVPDKAVLRLAGFAPDSLASASQPSLQAAARAAGSEKALLGTLRWSDADLGWVADWRLDGVSWQVRGVSFDEAFREAMRGSAKILSANGRPPIRK